MNTLCMWDRLEANISRMFRIYKSHFTTQTVVYHVLKWCWITARQSNKSAPYKVKSRHYKWRLLWQNIFFKKTTNFSSVHVRICVKDTTSLRPNNKLNPHMELMQGFHQDHIGGRQVLSPLFIRFPSLINVPYLIDASIAVTQKY